MDSFAALMTEGDIYYCIGEIFDNSLEKALKIKKAVILSSCILGLWCRTLPNLTR